MLHPSGTDEPRAGALPGAGAPRASPAWNLLTGTVTRYILLAVNIGLGLFLMPFTVGHLGTSEYGLWMLVASFTSYFQLLDLGYGSGLVRHIAEADARGDVGSVNRVLSTFVVVYAVLGVLAGVGVLALIALVIPRFPNLPAADVGRAQVLLAIMGARIAVGFPMTVFGAVSTARQRFAATNMVALVVTVANAAVTYAVLSRGLGLVPLVSATTLVGTASYGGYAWVAQRAFPQMQLRPALFDRSIVRDVTTFSVYLFLIDVAIQIGFNLDNLVVGAGLGTAAVGVYAIALRLADYQRQLCTQFTALLFPVVVRLGASGRREALRDMLVEGTRIALGLVVGVTVCVVGFAAPLIHRWMGPGFEGAVVPLYVLAVTGVILVGQGPLGNILLGTGRHRLVAVTSLMEALANLALSLALVRRFGLVGVAVGTGVPVFVANVFVLLPAACRKAGLQVGAFLRQVMVAPVIGAVPAAAVCLAFRIGLPPVSLPAILGQGAIVGLVYVLTVVTVGLSRAVRGRYAEFLRRLTRGAAPAAAGSSR